ncbi:MAG: antitoxin [Thermodesulfobacteriota bacterium]
MKRTQTAKLFKNGSSQAVRLPKEFRFPGDEVYITRDETTGDLILSNRPGVNAWKDLFDLIHSIDAQTDFMEERPLNVIAQHPGILDDITDGSE